MSAPDDDSDLDDMDWYQDVPDEVIPPFDAFRFLPQGDDIHETFHKLRKPDSSLDPLKPYTTPSQLEDLHLYFLGVWDKHHGF